MLFGAPAYEIRDGREVYFNRAYLVDGRGRDLGHYDKVHLVPYGEYVPLQKYMPFISKLTEAVGNYVPGQAGQVLKLGDERIGVLICFDSIFPELARKLVRSGADFLTVMTNDAWFGRSVAAYQHFDQARLRAVETRRTVIRAANTGISGIIYPSGRTGETLGLFQRASLGFEAPKVNITTLHSAVGDAASRLCLAGTLFVLAAAIIRRKKS